MDIPQVSLTLDVLSSSRKAFKQFKSNLHRILPRLVTSFHLLSDLHILFELQEVLYQFL